MRGQSGLRHLPGQNDVVTPTRRRGPQRVEVRATADDQQSGAGHPTTQFRQTADELVLPLALDDRVTRTPRPGRRRSRDGRARPVPSTSGWNTVGSTAGGSRRYSGPGPNPGRSRSSHQCETNVTAEACRPMDRSNLRPPGARTEDTSSPWVNAMRARRCAGGSRAPSGRVGTPRRTPRHRRGCARPAAACVGRWSRSATASNGAHGPPGTVPARPTRHRRRTEDPYKVTSSPAAASPRHNWST